MNGLTDLLQKLPGWLYFIIMLYMAYVVAASFGWAWNGLKHHGAYNKGEKRIYHVLWFIIDFPVVTLAATYILIFFAVAKIMNIKVTDKGD